MKYIVTTPNGFPIAERATRYEAEQLANRIDAPTLIQEHPDEQPEETAV